MLYHSSRIKLSTGQIFWREAGFSDRPVAIFLHGSWHDGSQWEPIVKSLTKNFHCFIPDLLGFGNSHANTTPTSIEMEVEFLHEFVSALKLPAVYIVGHSLGAWIAMSYALKYPSLVRGVVTIAPEGFSLDTLKQYKPPTKFLLAHPHLFGLWLNAFKLATSASDGARIIAKNQAYWKFFTKFPTTRKILFQRSQKAIRQELVGDRLAHLKPPLLVLQSESDDRYTIEQGQSIARTVRQSELKSIGKLDIDSLESSQLQIATEIQLFTDRVQLKIDREEVELW